MRAGLLLEMRQPTSVVKKVYFPSSFPSMWRVLSFKNKPTWMLHKRQNVVLNEQVVKDELHPE